MDDQANGSCWTLTTKVVFGIAGFMLLTWLIGGPEATSVLASAAG